MARVIVMPKMGEAMEEGQVTEWLIKEGESVEKNQPLFELIKPPWSSLLPRTAHC
mgnify:CR=1 FL=1